MEVNEATISMILCICIIMLIILQAVFLYFNGEKTKLELKEASLDLKGLLKTTPMTFKKQMTSAIKDALEEIDLEDLIPEVQTSSGDTLGTILGYLPEIADAWKKWREGAPDMGELAKSALKVGSDVVKEVAEESKKETR